MMTTRTIPLELLERAINSIGNFDLSYFGDKAEAKQLIADLEAVKAAEDHGENDDPRSMGWVDTFGRP